MKLVVNELSQMTVSYHMKFMSAWSMQDSQFRDEPQSTMWLYVVVLFFATSKVSWKRSCVDCWWVQESGQQLTVLEVGCGVGNFMFPLLSETNNIVFYACDFSPRAVQFVKVSNRKIS